PLLATCREQQRLNQKAKREWEQASASDKDRAKELDFLQYEIQEIRSAALQPGEDEELESSYRLMVNGQKIMETLSETGNLTGAGGYGGAEDEIGRAARAFSGIRDYDPALEELGTTLEDIESLLGEFNRSLTEYMGDMVFDPQKLRESEERLDLINRLKAKYGNSIEEILAACEEKEERVEVLMNYEAYLGGLRRTLDQSQRSLMETARELSAVRKQYAKPLAEQIRSALVDLNFLE
ncbi:MAG: DNA repair protein RecN, partial [Lachnospiraceae bacterium]|nr:DNA repair protein RecN [Lachnospiraceae bacterium]